MNVRIEYQYRDADNYKRHGSWTVPGVADEAALLATLNQDGLFVPDAVGMPMLTPGAGEWTESDHPFHEILSVGNHDGPVDEDRTFDQILRAFASADWESAGVDHEMALAA